MPGLRKALKRIGARKKAEKRKGDLMRPGKSATPDNPIEVKKGGRIKKKGSFPDLSGDGKTTMKDILIGRGVIKKGDKNMQKKTAMKRGSITDTSQLKEARAMIYKNGSRYRTSTSDPRDDYGYHYNNYVAAVVDMNGSSDYVELYGLTNKEGGTDCKITKSHEDSTYFGAFKIAGA